MQAKLSQTVTGKKSFFLKAVDPFFSKDGAGTLLPITITGKRDAPTLGVSAFHKTFKTVAGRRRDGKDDKSGGERMGRTTRKAFQTPTPCQRRRKPSKDEHSSLSRARYSIRFAAKGAYPVHCCGFMESFDLLRFQFYEPVA